MNLTPLNLINRLQHCLENPRLADISEARLYLDQLGEWVVRQPHQEAWGLFHRHASRKLIPTGRQAARVRL